MPLQDFLLDAIYVLGIIISALLIVGVISYYKHKDESIEEKSNE